MNKQFKNDKHAKLSPGREDIHQDDFNAKVIPCWQTMCAVHIDSMFEQKLVIHIEEEVEKLVHVLFHGLTSHEAPHVNLCTFLANPPNTSQSLALVGHCRAQGIGIHRMDEDHMIGSRQVGTRSRVLQGQQQNKGLLIINVGHEVAGVQKKKTSGALHTSQEDPFARQGPQRGGATFTQTMID